MTSKPNYEATRAAFEDLVGGEPFVRPIERIPSDPERYAFPGTYRDINTDLAWQAWKAAIAHATASERLFAETGEPTVEERQPTLFD